VRVYDFNIVTTPRGIAAPYMVLEWLDGEPLDVWLAQRRGRPVPEAEAVHLLHAAIEGLAHAHREGVAHRDVKPANIFVVGGPQGRMTKVLDFGIAKAMQEGETATLMRTRTSSGFSAFSPAYGAPEQFRSKKFGPTGPWTDVHALGLILTEMVTGRPALEGEEPGDFLVASTEEVRPSPRLRGGAVSEAFEAVCRRALSRAASDRYADAGELLKALDAAVAAPGPPRYPTPPVAASQPTVLPQSAWTPPVAPVAPVMPPGRPQPTPAPPPAWSAPVARPPATMLAEPGALAHAMQPAAQTPAHTPVPNRVWTPGPPQVQPYGPAYPPQASTTGGLESLRANPPPVPPKRNQLYVIAGAVGTVAFLALGGGLLAYRVAHAPHLHYCLDTDVTRDGPVCLFEVAPDIVGKRFDEVTRVTEVAGRVTTVEQVNAGGVVVERQEILRDASGAVTDVKAYGQFGANAWWQKWSDGGKRIDYVDIDGTTPRHLSRDSHVTSVRVDYDPQGRRTKLVYLGPTGRPRSQSGVYAVTMEYGRTPGTPIRRVFLGTDGKPAPNSQGVAIVRRSDSEQAWGDYTLFDVDDKPILSSGFHLSRELHDATATTGTAYFGLHEEPLVASSGKSTFHEVRYAWQPSTRTYVTSYHDEQGHPHPLRGEWYFAERRTYDERGELVLREFLDARGQRMLPTTGAAAVRSVYDDKGLLVRRESVDATGAPMQSDTVEAREEFKRDAHTNPVETRYYDTAGQPLAGGRAMLRETFDERDLWLTLSSFDAKGQAAAGKSGVWTTRNRYDRLRNETESASLGSDGKPMLTAAGYATRRWTYDENDDLVGVTYLDGNDQPTMADATSWATVRMKNDERGLVIEEDYLDPHGAPFTTNEGYASIQRKRDRNGDVVEETTLDKLGQPVLRDGGYARKTTVYDKQRRPVEVALFDAGGKAVLGKAGWALERTTYDERGNAIRVDHLDTNGAPVLDAEKRASVTRTYDARGNMIQETSLDTAGRPFVPSTNTYATRKYTYDDQDNITEEAFLGADGKPVACEAKWAAVRYRVDDLGNVLELTYLDLAHNPVVSTADKVGYASKHQRFDERHRFVEGSYFDEHGKPVKGPEGAAVVRYKRDAFNHAVETSYFDGSGNPTAGKEGKIAVHAKYDDAGNLLEERFFDGTGTPQAGTDGCASYVWKYDTVGRLGEFACLDVAGNSTIAKDVGWATRRTNHDDHGDATEVTTFGTDGLLHADKEGIARRRSVFDDRHRLVQTTYFDTGDAPVHDARGAYGVRYTYGDNGKQSPATLLDASGQPLHK
jgi:hypothetical protein